jgi:iron complex outermembrane recepter protein
MRSGHLGPGGSLNLASPVTIMITTLKRTLVPLALAIAPCISFAQEADTTKTFAVPLVTVTATRTSEPLTRVPMAVSVVDANQFASSKHYELKDALWSVPGVLTQARSGHTDMRVTIRGYGARGAGNRSNAGNMRGIRLLIDGIPETEPDGRTSLDLVNLDATSQLEVIRSNSSTLYGSASGGVINLSTNLTFDEPFIESRNYGGSFNFLRNALVAGTTFGQSHLLVAASNTTFGDDARMGYRQHSSASQLLFSAGLLSNLDSSTRFGFYASATSNLFRFPGPLTKEQFLTDPTQANAAFVARDERRYNRQGRIAATLEHDFGTEHQAGVTLFLQPKVLERSERNSYRDFNRYGVGAQGHYQWETAFSSTLENRVSAGFDEHYLDGTVLFYRLGPGGTRSDTLTQNKQEGANALGGYIEERMTIDSVFTIRLGGRYDVVSYIYRNFLAPGSSGPPQRVEYTQFTPKAGIAYELGAGHTVYAALGGGVEAPAFNEVDPPSDSLIIARGGVPSAENRDFNPILKAATSTSIEAGVRGLLPFDGPLAYLTYDVAAYMINVENDLVPWNGGAFYFTAAKTRRMGAEIGIGAGTDFNVSLQGALTVSRNTYVEYENQLGRFDGNDMAGLPNIFGNVRVRYDAPLGLFAETSVEHVGEYFADDRNDMTPDGVVDPKLDSKAPSYTLLGLSAGWRHDFGVFGVDLFASLNNITDENYVSSVFINGDSNQYFEPGMPRNVTVGLTLRYH